MTNTRIRLQHLSTRLGLMHAARTTVATTLSFIVARFFKLPEAYWAPVTTLVVTQSTLHATLSVSGKRLAGTAVGAVLGALVATWFGSNLVFFSLAVFLIGVFCAAARIDKTAYRFAGVTLVIVALIERTKPPWVVAEHRFIEVAIGIAVGLALASFWPEKRRKEPTLGTTHH